MEASSKPVSTRDAMLGGFVLMLIGGAALISELWPDLDRYLPVLVGLGLLAIFALSRWYLALVGGAVLTGLGVGLLVTAVIGTAEADGAGAVLGLAAGFISIWVVSRVTALKESHWWPLVPGGILTIVGTGLALDAVSIEVTPLVLPIVLLVFGALIIAISYIRTGRGHVGRTT